MDINRNLEGSFKCALCKQFCKEPKVLPCLHSTCSNCVKAVASTLQTIRCRICLEDTNSSDAKNLPDNYWLTELQLADHEKRLLKGRFLSENKSRN